MREKKSEKGLQESMEGVLTKEKIDELYKTITTNQNAFGTTYTLEEYTGTEQYAQEILERRQQQKIAEQQLLENKKKYIEDLGLKWDSEIVAMIEDRGMWYFPHPFGPTNTEVPEQFKKRADALAMYVKKHTKIGGLL